MKEGAGNKSQCKAHYAEKLLRNWGDIFNTENKSASSHRRQDLTDATDQSGSFQQLSIGFDESVCYLVFGMQELVCLVNSHVGAAVLERNVKNDTIHTVQLALIKRCLRHRTRFKRVDLTLSAKSTTSLWKYSTMRLIKGPGSFQ